MIDNARSSVYGYSINKLNQLPMIKEFYRLFGLTMLVLLTYTATFGQQQVSGIVRDADGTPVPGVNIVIKGTTTGTSTDAEGRFNIQAKQGDVLAVSFIGYQSQELHVGSQTNLEIVLQEDLTTLSEVVVIGYGEQKKTLNTGANLQVKGEDIQKLSTTNALQALQGQAPGVQITSTSGQPGEALRVLIRGAGTKSNPSPLYVVDGVLTGDINFLNPADIQSIDVLKDAASAAIYGSQAANGVILITTRKGSAGRAQLSFDAFYGVQNRARKIPMLNAYEYAVIINEAAVNSGKAPYFNDQQMSNIRNGVTGWESAPNTMGLGADQIAAMRGGTDWLDQMFVDNAPTQNYVLSLSGGSDISSYSSSLSYLTQSGIVGGSDYSDYQRYNFRFNSDHKLYQNKVRFGQTLNFAWINNHGIAVGGQYGNSLRSAFQASPFLPVYDANGKLWNNAQSRWLKQESNPYAQMVYNNQNRNNSQRLLGNIYLEVEPIKSLKLRTQLGVDYSAGEGRSFTPVYELSLYSRNDTTRVTQFMNKSNTLIWDNIASYTINIKDHNIDMMIGTAAYRGRGTSMFGANYNLSFNDLEHAWLSNALNKTNAARMTLNGAPNDDDNRMSYFARVHYNFNEKYLLNATLRRDGSSRFAPGHRWGMFPSVSAGWLVTSEDFFSGLTTFVDQLKLRASWGQVGNQNIGFFNYISPIQFEHINYPFGTTEGGLTPGAYPSRIANPEAIWETSEQINIGIDATLLQGRLTAALDWYNKTTKDWLVEAPILATAGADAPFINGGNVTNKGIELALSYSGEAGALRYTVGANGAYNKNTVSDIPTADGIIHGPTNFLFANSQEFNRIQEGYPLGYFWGLTTDGIFQNAADVQAYSNADGEPVQPGALPGDVRYVDQNDDGRIDNQDRTMIGNPHPDFTFGFNVNVTYKGFDLNVLGNGVAGNQIVQSYREQASSFGNYTADILNRWHGEGTSNRLPRVNESNTNWVNFSDLFIQDGDFLRISNITLGYDLARLIKVKAFSQLRVYGSVLNAFTFTKYTGMDPEVSINGNSIDNHWTTGVDLGYYPRPRTVMVGLNVKF
jgi:TonB-dependent starch-binding outer membrane protein SusC